MVKAILEHPISKSRQFYKLLASVTHVFVSLFLLIPFSISGQEVNSSETTQVNFKWTKMNKEGLFKPYLAIETWATYSMGEDKGCDENKSRSDIFMRRFRFGAKGKPYKWLKYNFQLHLDRLGEDYYSSTKGSYKGIDIWNAFITAKLLNKSELLYLHAGYFWAAVSREFNTSPWAVGSFDKERATWFMRKFVTGTGNGIESGIALGGLVNYNNFGVSYRLGMYEPEAYACGKYASKLFTGRVMLSFGDAEQSSYKYMLSGNQWLNRKGITLGFGASSQSNGQVADTVYFKHSVTYGADILMDFKGLRLDAEYYLLYREDSQLEDYNGSQWHIRLGYSMVLGNKFIEPVISYDKYDGKGSNKLFQYIGDDKTFDVGVNWYLNKDKLKLALHYIIQDGSAAQNTGNYAGASFQFKL